MKKLLSIISFLIVAILLHAQPEYCFNCDTIWIETGEIIACKINKASLSLSTINVKTIDSVGQISDKSYPKSQIIRIQEKSKVIYISGESRNMFPKRTKIYGTIGIGFPYSVKAGLNIISKKNLGVGIYYKSYFTKAENIPVDYSSGAFAVFGDPKDKIKILSFSIQKVFEPVAIHPARLMVEIGLSRTEFAKAHFNSLYFPVLTSLTGNYDVNYTSETTIGLALRAGFDFPVKRLFGFELAFTGNITQYKNVFGIELNLLIGRVRNY